MFWNKPSNLSDTNNRSCPKFIWNQHYLAAKVPEQIKREIVNKQEKYGGFGMLDVSELDSSLKSKAIGRLIQSKHPFLSLIKASLD